MRRIVVLAAALTTLLLVGPAARADPSPQLRITTARSPAQVFRPVRPRVWAWSRSRRRRTAAGHDRSFKFGATEQLRSDRRTWAMSTREAGN
jgi:hypothetical protein